MIQKMGHEIIAGTWLCVVQKRKAGGEKEITLRGEERPEGV